MADRYYVPEFSSLAKASSLVGAELAITGAESKHLAQVMRVQPGQMIEIFDGAGGTASAEITSVSKRDTVVSIREYVHRPASASPLTIVTALPKQDRSEWLIEKLCELGVERVVPTKTRRSIVELTESKLSKFERLVIESCKQCARDWLMVIEPMQRFESIAKSLTGTRWILDPNADFVVPMQFEIPSAIAIGPEGDWDPTELQLAEDLGWKRVRLPTPVLRVETAAIAAASLVKIATGNRTN